MTAPWYVKSFGRFYLEHYSHRNDDEAVGEVEALVALLDPDREGPLLDLCCGAGRHLKALRRLGFSSLAGLDLSAELLQVAAEELDEVGGEAVEIIHADMRRIPHRDHYATVLSLFTSFGYFAGDDENASVVNGVYQSLRPGGRFLIDTLNRDYVMAELQPESVVEREGFSARSRRRITADGRRVEKVTVVRSTEGEEETFEESVRLFSAGEMAAMLAAAGFEDIRIYGALCAGPLTPSCERMVVTGVKGR
jgi:ubiquinone/menaquinone biosynthesis C-methylase UbiE